MNLPDVILEIAKVTIPALLGFIGGLLRGRQENENRFKDDERRAFHNALKQSDMLLHDIRLNAAYVLSLKRTADGDIDLDKSNIDREKLKALTKRLQDRKGLYGDLVTENIPGLSLYTRRSMQRYAAEMMEPLTEMADVLVEHNDAYHLPDCHCEQRLSALEQKYLTARERYRRHARRSLGIKD